MILNLKISTVILFTMVISAWVIIFAWTHERRRGRRRERKHRKKRLKAVAVYNTLKGEDLAPGQKLAYIRKMDAYAFEEMMLDAFERNEYHIVRNERYSGDGGIDGRVVKDGKMYLIQCKRYRKYINSAHLADFIETCEKMGVEGFFVHTGKTGRKAKTIVGSSGVTILSGMRLIDFIFPKTR